MMKNFKKGLICLFYEAFFGEIVEEATLRDPLSNYSTIFFTVYDTFLLAPDLFIVYSSKVIVVNGGSRTAYFHNTHFAYGVGHLPWTLVERL
ncbi:hypothetical protein L6452_31589 [Arctium lappa]|uniref:Uncharacterized protein n=1 Tax=Arctium lappa TaxID=4217 RepID=A0ACB8Z1W0_ARCLA|nr:hypothetical protein L6452_31589 [Arctium lappa]